jgi:hypothetical protein
MIPWQRNKKRKENKTKQKEIRSCARLEFFVLYLYQGIPYSFDAICMVAIRTSKQRKAPAQAIDQDRYPSQSQKTKHKRGFLTFSPIPSTVVRESDSHYLT